MPISGKSGYPSTLRAFVSHWESVNASLPSPLILPPAANRPDVNTVDNLRRLSKELDTSLANLQQKISASAETRQILGYAKRGILYRAQTLVRNFGTDDPKSRSALPALPAMHDERERFVRTLESLDRSWQEEEHRSGVRITLAGAYSRTSFLDEISNIQELWAGYFLAHSGRIAAREAYDRSLVPLTRILSDYHSTIERTFPRDSAVRKSLPPVHPPSSHPPKSVTATGIWDNGVEKANIRWEAADETGPFHYEVRYSPGDRYDPEVESVIASVPPEGKPSVFTTEGLRRRGDTALFRVYVVLPNGAEAPGETLAIVNGPDAG